MLYELACEISVGLKEIRFNSYYAVEFPSKPKGLKNVLKCPMRLKTLGDTGSAKHPQEIFMWQALGRTSPATVRRRQIREGTDMSFTKADNSLCTRGQ